LISALKPFSVKIKVSPIPGIRVPKDMCLPREISHVALERRERGELAEGRVIDPERMREVSPAKKRRDKLQA
jgi:hypothetical protein